MSKQTKFNRDEVIEKATNLYWEKGYHGTSMRDLQNTVDLRPGSIYATFGSKDNLYSEAVNHYAQTTRSVLQSFLSESPSSLIALKRFIKNIIVDNKESSPSCMCMLVKSASELTETSNKALFDEVKSLINGVEMMFCEIIKAAINEGEISKDKDPLELARYLQVQVIGLRTYSLINDNITIIEKFIDDLFITPPFK